jgi:hypothetical protein
VGRNVVFTGFVSEEVKIGALDASTALVLPSVKPAVASAVGEIPYRVRHMVNGLPVPPREVLRLVQGHRRQSCSIHITPH